MGCGSVLRGAKPNAADSELTEPLRPSVQRPEDGQQRPENGQQRPGNGQAREVEELYQEFLAALPEDLRDDAMAQASAHYQWQVATPDPDFLAAMPADIRAELQYGQADTSSAVDPSFMAALPPDIRAELEAARSGQPDPEFLAALPPEIRAEVEAGSARANWQATNGPRPATIQERTQGRYRLRPRFNGTNDPRFVELCRQHPPAHMGDFVSMYYHYDAVAEDNGPRNFDDYLALASNEGRQRQLANQSGAQQPASRPTPHAVRHPGASTAGSNPWQGSDMPSYLR